MTVEGRTGIQAEKKRACYYVIIDIVRAILRERRHCLVAGTFGGRCFIISMSRQYRYGMARYVCCERHLLYLDQRIYQHDARISRLHPVRARAVSPCWRKKEGRREEGRQLHNTYMWYFNLSVAYLVFVAQANFLFVAALRSAAHFVAWRYCVAC